jgi:hypothetical protein
MLYSLFHLANHDLLMIGIVANSPVRLISWRHASPNSLALAFTTFAGNLAVTEALTDTNQSNNSDLITPSLNGRPWFSRARRAFRPDEYPLATCMLPFGDNEAEAFLAEASHLLTHCRMPSGTAS